MNGNKSSCGRCQVETNHHIIHHDTEDLESLDKIKGPRRGIDHLYRQCAGCDKYSYVQEHWEMDPYKGKLIRFRKTCPVPENENRRTAINYSHELPNSLEGLYHEVIDAINAQFFNLSTLGLRMLIEEICKDQQAKGENLKDKINELAKNGRLTRDQADILHKLRLMGNDVAHESRQVSQHEISMARKIVETMMENIYMLPKLGNEITVSRKGTAQDGSD